MKLYHGTNIDFKAIDLTKSNQYKDFGRGFYLTVVKFCQPETDECLLFFAFQCSG